MSGGAPFTIQVDGHAVAGAVTSELDALAALNNALCCTLPRTVEVFVDQQGEAAFHGALARLQHGPPSELLRAAEAVNRSPTQISVQVGPPPPSRPRRLAASGVSPHTPTTGCWVGIDLGGTDVKLVATVDGEATLERTLVHPVGLGELHTIEAWQAVLDPLLDQARASLPAISGVGLALPFLVHHSRIYGGLSSKTKRLQRALGAASAEGVAVAIETLPARAAARLGAPCTPLTDGLATAAARATAPGTLWMSLGTSITGALTGPEHTLLPYPSYVSALVSDPGATSAEHRTTGLRGTLQQGLTQAGLLARLPPSARHGSPAEAVRAAVTDPQLTSLWDELGRRFAHDLRELRRWLPEVERVFLLGRLVAPPHPALLPAINAESPVPVMLPPPLDLPFNAATHAQAWGALRFAAGRAR